MKAKYADALVSRGQIRIGTLYDFRREELHGTEVGDKSESAATVQGYQARLPRRFNPGKFVGKQPLSTTYAGGHLTRDKQHKIYNYTTQDAYVFCASWNLNPQMGVDFGSAVVAIRNVQSFIQAIARALPPGIQSWDFGRCVYKGKEEPAKLKQLPPLPLWKPPRYGYQDEWRAWFVTDKQSIEPVIIESFDIAKYCSIL